MRTRSLRCGFAPGSAFATFSYFLSILRIESFVLHFPASLDSRKRHSYPVSMQGITTAARSDHGHNADQSAPTQLIKEQAQLLGFEKIGIVPAGPLVEEG